jgi:hypothetical protein
VRSGASEVRDATTLFFMLGWSWCRSHKKCEGTHYGKLAFLHLVRSADNVVHLGAFRALNIDTLFFMLGRARCGSHKKHIETRYDELLFFHPV